MQKLGCFQNGRRRRREEDEKGKEDVCNYLLGAGTFARS
jgi:hypothetical protein